MGTVTGTIVDALSGKEIAAKVSVQGNGGLFHAPESSIATVGTTNPYFYADGSFSVDLPRGQADVRVERGTEYAPLHVTVSVPLKGTVNLSLAMQRWIRLDDQGWYPGNTHIHYREYETRPEERLRFDTEVEDLTVTVISVLQQQELAYATNRFPVGRMDHPTRPHWVLDVGEETRHNAILGDSSSGYGHVMLVRLQEQVEPLSRGVLVDDSDPDYPPLIDACDTARAQGGVVIWCHNGWGMEAPIAASLQRIDALNLFDPYWLDTEYDLWYHLLNCGFKLPASTGSDWYVCSANRVYTHLEQSFSYDSWLETLTAGRSFITNGPVLDLTVEGQPPGQVLDLRARQPKQVRAEVRWQAHLPIERVEIIMNGAVVAGEHAESGTQEGRLTATLVPPGDGWIAARCAGRSRDSYGHAQWAHTSPVYLRAGGRDPATKASAQFFVAQIERSLQWITEQARFEDIAHRQRMQQLFRDGRESFLRLARE